MVLKKNSTETVKSHWGRNVFFFSIALIALGKEIERYEQEEGETWQ